MKIGIASDLHLEFRDDEYAKEVQDQFNRMTNLDWLIIAGDVHSDRKKRSKFMLGLDVPVKFVMGNHDYYRQEVFDDFFDEDGIVGGCLWTNFGNDPIVELAAKNEIWDFKYISNWSTTQSKFMHEEHKRKIFESSSEIVVTHFAPCTGSIHPNYRGDPINKYFVNNMDNQIAYSNKKLWIHGHVHDRFDYMVGDCRIICNPWGYPLEKDNPSLVQVIEI